ncbi:4-hydroxybenzoate octaprenyltransferase [Candidatus Erwinia haradaeae]|uniref:4-hydroxybenzoate octaprenyltransferase n=1 Tax=Candidatus Erwinia haradaeae TaxID=1922217 RepID=A0A451D1Y1_9GAMM|nr:4-hydroxybenzoate octaprenyltransferase [Candidatus Erwinia haradaeae]VFP79619.1 4-hydroxybenzoate octaprenyltransferase [Candidatus Erwinia haradaeae]
MQSILKISNLRAYYYLLRINQPSGLFLLLWPTLWALWLSGLNTPPLKIFLVFVLGVFFMRSAGCVVNDIVDLKIDGHILRTKERVLPSGEISIQEAKFLYIGLLLISCCLVCNLHFLTIYLSLFGLVLTCIYPFMKRYTHLPQVILGLSFSWGIPMAWVEVSNSITITCFLLFLANLCWVVSYDTQYSMADRADDLKMGVKSTAILFGCYDKIIISLLQLVTLLLLTLVGLLIGLHLIFYISILIACVLFIYQQVLINNREPDLCLKAFMQNNWVGLIIFIGIASSI